MKQEPRVSVVTPVYNGERYLAECIESVRNQVYSNWDYTIVDNCSSDRTFEIAERYAARDSRIKVVRNGRFVSATANHNVAFGKISADSKYCKMVLADDFLFPRCIEEMVQVGETHSSVGIVGAYGLYGSEVVWGGLPYPSTIINGRELCRWRLRGGPYVFGTPTSVMFRCDVIRGNQPFFDEASQHPDTEACFDALQRWDFGFVHQVLSFTRVDDEGLSADWRKYGGFGKGGALADLVRFGPVYLDPEERETRLVEHLRQYYRFLGREALHRRDPDFWRHHRERLSSVGMTLDRSRVGVAAAIAMIDAVLALNTWPWALIKGIRRRLGRVGAPITSVSYQNPGQ
jgi:glycosyltransferase involved in cell wall biosynthesis